MVFSCIMFLNGFARYSRVSDLEFEKEYHPEISCIKSFDITKTVVCLPTRALLTPSKIKTNIVL